MHLLTAEFAVQFQTNTLNRAELLYRVPPHFLSDFNLPINFVKLEVFVLEEPGVFIFRVIKQEYPYILKMEASFSVRLSTIHATA